MNNLVIIEAAVFDTAPKNFFDELWYVYTTKENRIVRLMENRGYSREKCEDIIGRQASEEEYRALCRPCHRQQRGRIRYQTTAEGDP